MIELPLSQERASMSFPESGGVSEATEREGRRQTYLGRHPAFDELRSTMSSQPGGLRALRPKCHLTQPRGEGGLEPGPQSVY